MLNSITIQLITKDNCDIKSVCIYIYKHIFGIMDYYSSKIILNITQI